MSKHTPGPWTTAPNGGDDDDTRELFVCAGAREQAIAEAYTGPDSGDPEANARLIAAAPDLLAALREIAALPSVDGLDPFEANRRGQELRLNEQARSIARAAIAKAEGAP